MSALQFSAVEGLAHVLAEPVVEDTPLVADIEARTARMIRSVDAVMARFAPSEAPGEAERANHLDIVRGLVAMMSGGIAAYAEKCAQIENATIRTAMYEAHDQMVRDYYRLLALMADLDPGANAPGPELKTAEDIKAWFAEALG